MEGSGTEKSAAESQDVIKVKMHLSEELSSCEQKLKEAQTAKESLEKCQKELAALEQKEKVLQDKLLKTRNIYSSAAGSLSLLIKQSMEILQLEKAAGKICKVHRYSQVCRTYSRCLFG